MIRYCYNCMESVSSEKCGLCGYTFKAPPTHHLLQGTVLNNRYLIGNVIGEGGFGITYIGRDLNLDMKVAIKEFYPKGFVNRNNLVSNRVDVNGKTNREFFDKGRKKLIREARVLAKFSGTKSIVDVRDYFEENNTGYIVMEYVRGETLKNRVKEQGAFPPDELVSKMMPLFYALEKVHGEGLIHRDISPDNIMIVNDGSLKLMDFGATRNVNFITDQTLSVMLKPGYAPEEQYRAKGSQGPWTDVYAVCATVYKCITGITPDDSLERSFSDKLKKPSELGIDISEGLESIILKGMSPRREDRYQSMNELIDDILIFNPREPVTADNDECDDNDNTVYYTEDDSSTLDYSEPEKEQVQSQQKSSRIVKRLFFIIAVIIIGGIITGFVINEQASYTKVPNVFSLTEKDAENAIKDSELKFNVKYEFSDKLGKGKVIMQKPAKGESVKKNSTVTFTVSSGKLVSVPNVEGFTLKKAKQLVKESSLMLTVKSTNYSNKVKKGLIISQTPEAAAILAEGETVNVIISKGQKPVNVPNLKGLTLNKAKIKGKSFNVKVKYVFSDSANGTVIAQSLKEGDKVAGNTELVLTVSKGAEPTVPTEPEIEYVTDYEPTYSTEATENTEQSATQPQTLGELKFDD